MKRAPMNAMRNAPKINDADLMAKRPAAAPSTPAAPAIGALQQRMSTMTGDSITLHINGRDIAFKLRVIAAEAVERATMVFAGNERDQELLSESSLGDILPTFRSAGQQFPAIGRDVNGIVEVADGSRRRIAAILSGCSYRVLVGELTNDDMKWLTKLGNDYTPPSAYERGKRYTRMLKTDFDGNLSSLATAEGISRRVLTRYIKTATLPIEVIKAFPVPNDLSMKSGETLAGLLLQYREDMISAAIDIAERRDSGEEIDADSVFNELKSVASNKKRLQNTTREFGKGIKAVYKEGKVTVQLQDVPEQLVKEVENILEKHARQQIASSVNLSLNALEEALNIIQEAEEKSGITISSYDDQDLIKETRVIISNTKNHDEQLNKVIHLIKNKVSA